MGKEAKVQPDRTSGLKDDRFCLEITPAGGGVGEGGTGWFPYGYDFLP